MIIFQTRQNNLPGVQDEGAHALLPHPGGHVWWLSHPRAWFEMNTLEEEEEVPSLDQLYVTGFFKEPHTKAGYLPHPSQGWDRVRP